MSRHATALFLAALLSGSLAAQNDVIHYPFVTGSGTNVLNLAQPAMPGTITGSTVANAWTTGKTSSALRGASNQAPTSINPVDTGWKPVLNGDFTVAWFMQQENSPGTTLSYIFSNVGSFRCFTNGVASKGLYLRAWGGTPADLTTATDIQALAAKGWVHVACVVDWTGSKTATWYLDGQVDKVIPLTAGANLSGTSNMFIGQHTSATTAWTYNTDEFRLSTRAVSPGEIASWASMTPGGAGAYNVNAACGGAKLEANGAPSVGNAKFQMKLTGPASGAFVLSLGSDRQLSFDLGVLFAGLNGCEWSSTPVVLITGATGSTGMVDIPMPIPNAPGLNGVLLWNQALVITQPLTGTQATNGLNLFIN